MSMNFILPVGVLNIFNKFWLPIIHFQFQDITRSERCLLWDNMNLSISKIFSSMYLFGSI